MSSAAGAAPAADPAAVDGAAALEAVLAGAGLGARVQAEGRLALLSAAADLFADPATRAVATRLARMHGFTHVALLLDDEGPAAGAAAGAAADDAPR